MMQQIFHIHETCLYATDLDATREFYTRIIGLRVVSDMSRRGCVLRVNDRQVLILFDPSETVQPNELVPSHGATGAGHMALAVPTGGLSEWRRRLESERIPIEREITWQNGAKSIYVRDPAGNSLEFIEGELWPA